MSDTHPLGHSALAFLEDLAKALENVIVTTATGSPLATEAGLEQGVQQLRDTAAHGGKLYLIGNGGSAAIASHMALDFWKNGKLPALAFNDSSLLTAIGNDCGFEQLFALPIQTFATAADTVLAISSSGRSPNILEGVKAARDRGAAVLTMSAFAPDNPLRAMGDLNFYLPSPYYGHAEVGHLALVHALLDAHMGYTSSPPVW